MSEKSNSGFEKTSEMELSLFVTINESVSRSSIERDDCSRGAKIFVSHAGWVSSPFLHERVHTTSNKQVQVFIMEKRNLIFWQAALIVSYVKLLHLMLIVDSTYPLSIIFSFTCTSTTKV